MNTLLAAFVAAHTDYPADDPRCWAWVDAADQRCTNYAHADRLCPRHHHTAQTRLQYAIDMYREGRQWTRHHS